MHKSAVIDQNPLKNGRKKVSHLWDMAERQTASQLTSDSPPPEMLNLFLFLTKYYSLHSLIAVTVM